MPVIGTAGHVDHGKSTLIRALTGRDPDRWEEEKRRGLTIDLGFAWTELPGGTEVGFVDVPGHEKFIKNMLAGVDAIDAALFVVAADEGWMPQSEEHLAVLDLLDIRHAVVALTRVDLVDDDLRELAELEAEERLAGTSLENAPIVPVSAPTGEGIDRLTKALAEVIEASGGARDEARPRLWVDRAFVIAGAGTVVTGTLTGGRLAVGDMVALYPGEMPSRIRSLQSHEVDRDTVEPGNRTAINLAGLEHAAVTRGAMLGTPGAWRETERAVVEVRPVREQAEHVTNRGAYHLHFGSGAWPVRLQLLDADDLEGEGTALLHIEHSLPMAVGDRFVIRDVGRRAVVAGGRVLDPAPHGRIASLRGHLPSLRTAVMQERDAQAQVLLESRGRAALDDLAAWTGGGRPEAGILAGEVAISKRQAHNIEQRAVELAAAYHDANPLRPGIPKASLASGAGVSIGELEAVLSESASLFDQGATVRTKDFTGGWDERREQIWLEARGEIAAAGLAVPRASQLGFDAETHHALVRMGRLTQIADDLVYLPEQIEEIYRKTAELPPGFTVAEFRDHLGITRRQAVPLLEWLDRSGVTARDGDRRVVRRLPPGGPPAGDDPPR